MVDDATLKEISIPYLTISGEIGLIKYCYWQQIGLVYGTFFCFSLHRRSEKKEYICHQQGFSFHEHAKVQN